MGKFHGTGVDASLKTIGASLEDQNRAAAFKLRAERQAGGMLASVERSKGGRNPAHDEPSFRLFLQSFNLNPSKAKRLQAVAAVPQRHFDLYIENTIRAGRKLSTAALLRACLPPKAKPESPLAKIFNSAPPIVIAGKRKSIMCREAWCWIWFQLGMLGDAKPEVLRFPSAWIPAEAPGP